MEKIDIKLLKADLLENGMCSDIFPKYINTKGLSNIKYRSIKENDRESSPATINLLKNDGGNRVIYLPNPISYQQCITEIFKNEDMVGKLLNKIEMNEYSQSKVVADDKLFNIPIKRKNSGYMKSLREKMYLSIGKKYKLKYDIEKFYDNIYTHYLPAGLIGFSDAIGMYRGSIEESEEYKYMCSIDKEIRNMSNKETKGIITGPFISRIISELLLSEIDKEIIERVGNKNYRRYVDDGEMFFNTLDEAEKCIENLKNIFQKYKLSLKMEKTEIKKIPYIDFHALREITDIRRIKNRDKKGWYLASQDDFFEVITKAEKMQKNGNKGAMKYILKLLVGQKNEYGINKSYSEKDKSFLFLLNYLIIYPQYSHEIMKIVERQIDEICESEQILNNFLKQSIEGKQDVVCLFIIETMVKHRLLINIETVKEYLNGENNNEILEASFIEYLCMNNLNGEYTNIIMDYKTKLKGIGEFDFMRENWLSQYVLYFNDYIEETEFSNTKNVLNNLRMYKEKKVKFIDFSLINEL